MFHYRRQRSLPLALTITCFFGGSSNVVTWLILGFSLIFVRAAVWRADFEGLYASYDASTQGVVSEAEATTASEGSSKHGNGRRIYRYTYRYSVDGRTLSDTSYSSGSFSTDERVTVEYSSRNPSISRIKGTRAHVFSAGVACILIFPLIASWILCRGLWRGWKASSLLREGVLTTGKLIEKRSTSVMIGDRPVIEYVFSFAGMDGVARETVVRTHSPWGILDEEHETIMYHPSRPNQAMLVDDMPARVRLAPDGSIQSYEGSVFWVAIPIFIIGAHLMVPF